MNPPVSNRVVVWTLTALLAFGALSAGVGAVLAIALLLSAVAGFGMLIWIFVQLALMQQFSWLQAAYFILGGLELVLVLALLGIVPALVNPLPEARAPTHRWRGRTRA